MKEYPLIVLNSNEVQSCERCWSSCEKFYGGELKTCFENFCDEKICLKCVQTKCAGCGKNMQFCQNHLLCVSKMDIYTKEMKDDLFCPPCRDYDGVL